MTLEQFCSQNQRLVEVLQVQFNNASTWKNLFPAGQQVILNLTRAAWVRRSDVDGAFWVQWGEKEHELLCRPVVPGEDRYVDTFLEKGEEK